MPTDDDKIITTTVCVGQSLAFTQHNDIISITDQLMVLLDKGLLVCNFPFNRTISGTSFPAVLALKNERKTAEMHFIIINCYSKKHENSSKNRKPAGETLFLLF